MMDEALKVRFRQFADSWNDADIVDESGLTGADLKRIATRVEDIFEIPRLDLGE